MGYSMDIKQEQYRIKLDERSPMSNALYSYTATLTPAHLIGRKTEDGQAFHYTSAGYVSRPVANDNVVTTTMRLARPSFLPSLTR